MRSGHAPSVDPVQAAAASGWLPDGGGAGGWGTAGIGMPSAAQALRRLPAAHLLAEE